jgi:predicted NBD/HSP70 family sugar kinase
MARHVVLDIGGTNLRSAVFDTATAQLLDVRRGSVASFLTDPGATADQLVEALLAQVQGRVRSHAAHHPITAVGVAFPGPVNHRGEVHSAPTLWGSTARGVPLRDMLQRELDVPVVVMNDISAAVYRYEPRYREDFSVLTISSGIGNKIFAAGRLLLNAQGLGGELGHHQVVEGDDALPCDCGGRGHLGAVASGRGAERLARLWARRDPHRFAASALWYATAGDAERIDTRALVAALQAGDELAREVLRFGQAHLAACIALLYNAMGLKRFVLIGGFCLAVGDLYLSELRAQLDKRDLFGLSADERHAMIHLGERDDDHSLYGLGQYFRHHEPCPAGSA